MNEKVFRKKSIDQVNSPEDLNSYLRVTTPPIWFAIIAITILVAGALIWACTAKLETTTSGLVISDGDEAACYVFEDSAVIASEKSYVRLNDQEYPVTAVTQQSVTAKSVYDSEALKATGLKGDEKLISLTLQGKIEAGTYPCEIVLESISPIWFLFNSSGTTAN